MLKWFADRLAQTGRDARKDERGFTLIELLVVVIIIGILAAIAIPTYLSQVQNGRDAEAESTAREYATATSAWLADSGDSNYANVDAAAVQGIEPALPTSIQGQGNITVAPAGTNNENFTVSVPYDDGAGGGTATFNSGTGNISGV